MQERDTFIAEKSLVYKKYLFFKDKGTFLLTEGKA